MAIKTQQILVQSSIKDTNTDAMPSATADSTKNYVGGGTTPDSNIIVAKPKPNYFVYGFLGIVVAYVGYQVFFNKKIR